MFSLSGGRWRCQNGLRPQARSMRPCAAECCAHLYLGIAFDAATLNAAGRFGAPGRVERMRPARCILSSISKAKGGRDASFLNKTDTPNEGWEKDRVPTCTSRILEGRSGTHRGMGVGSASRHGGGPLGRVHPHDRVPGIPLSYSYRTKLHPAAWGQARASYLLVALS